MASSAMSSLIPQRVLTQKYQNPKPFLSNSGKIISTNSKTRVSFTIQAAKLPSGVIVPKVEPRFSPPFLGFTKVAETWNSRACMIGLIGTFVVELILGKGILEVVGFEIGKGLDIPL